MAIHSPVAFMLSSYQGAIITPLVFPTVTIACSVIVIRREERKYNQFE